MTSGEEGAGCLDVLFLGNCFPMCMYLKMTSYIVFLKLCNHLTEVIKRSASICANVRFIIKD